MSETKAAVKEAMNAWGREFLRGGGFDVLEDAEITYEEESRSDGYCETCYYDYYVVVVSDGTHKEEYSGDFAELLRDMTGKINY